MKKHVAPRKVHRRPSFCLSCSLHHQSYVVVAVVVVVVVVVVVIVVVLLNDCTRSVALLFCSFSSAIAC